MSRVGKKIINIPNGVEVVIDGDKVKVKGPKGELSLVSHPKIILEKNDSVITVNVSDPENKDQRAIWGTTRKLIFNLIEGVKTGFEKKLEINGVGYNLSLSGSKLTLNVGFSHPVIFPLPTGISAVVEKNTITLSGIDKQLVGETAAQIRKIKKPEPYKGKGIKYSNELVRRKAGKTSKK